MKNYDGGCCFRSSPHASEVRVLWELTTSCNLLCDWCHTKNISSSILSFKNIQLGLKRLRDFKVKDIIFSGGEPLLRHDIFDILNIAKDTGFEIDLCTNATLVDDYIAKQLNNVLSEISISLDSSIEAKHDRIRGVPGCFEQTIRGIKLLKNLGLEIHIISLYCNETANNVEELLLFIDELEINSITFLGLIPIEGITTKQILSRNNRTSIINCLEKYRRMFPQIAINTKKIIKDDCGKLCSAGDSILGINSGGTLLPCIMNKTMFGIQYEEWVNSTLSLEDLFRKQVTQSCKK